MVIAHLDFSKVFRTVSHSLLPENPMRYSLGECPCGGGELGDRLHPEVVANGSSANGQPVTSGVPQGSILGPRVFHVFISDLDGGIKCSLMKFAAGTKLSGEADASEGRATLQEGLDGLEEWVTRTL